MGLCIRAFVHLRVRVLLPFDLRTCVRSRARARVERECVCATRLCWPSCGTAAGCGIYSSACHAGRPRVRGCVCHRWSVASAAGVTWSSRTTSAPWAARYAHTSVIDAAGAIYVIGGYNSTSYFNDVLVSTDGGA